VLISARLPTSGGRSNGLVLRDRLLGLPGAAYGHQELRLASIYLPATFRLLGRWQCSAFDEVALERFHQVDHLGRLGEGTRRRNDAFKLVLDEAPQRVLVGVPEIKDVAGNRWMDMPIAPESELWWSPKSCSASGSMKRYAYHRTIGYESFAGSATIANGARYVRLGNLRSVPGVVEREIERGAMEGGDSNWAQTDPGDMEKACQAARHRRHQGFAQPTGDKTCG